MPLCPFQASSQIPGDEGAERSEAPEAPRYPLKASSKIPGAEGAERSKAPEAPRYPNQLSSFLFGVDADIISVPKRVMKHKCLTFSRGPGGFG